ncbi:MAG: hypothetical protein ACYDHW_06670 [Syntrophorhabdaceae bacterium]
MTKKEALFGETSSYTTINRYDLEDGETARDPYAFPETNTCPKCGNVGGNIHRETYFQCYKCRLVCVVIPEPVMPLTEEMKGHEYHDSVPMIDTVCPTCGIEFKKRESTPSPNCRWCTAKISADNWRRTHPARYKKIQKKHEDKRVKQRATAGAIA